MKKFATLQMATDYVVALVEADASPLSLTANSDATYTVYEQGDVLPGLTAAQTTEIYDAAVSENIGALWQAAHDYEYAQINGVAIGLLTIGVIQKLPVSLAIAAWSASIWNLYYARKSSVTDVLDSALLDFTSCGNIPHTIPELRIELGM